MFHSSTVKALAAALVVFLSMSPAAQAQDKAPTIAIVDVQKILADAKAAQSLEKQIQAKREAFQKEFAAKEADLKKSQNDIIAQKEKLAAADFDKKRMEFEKKVSDTKSLFEKRRNALQQGSDKAIQELRKNIIESAAKVADSKGYDIVLTRDSVIVAEKTLDITADVLKQIDSTLTDVKLQVQ